MTRASKLTTAYILWSVPSIIYGGYFLLTVMSGQQDHFALTDFQKSMFRAGHAHAGVLVLLALQIQTLVDATKLSIFWQWTTRISFPVAAILISSGFFAAAIGQGITKPSQGILILYVGIVSLLVGLITLGIGLARK